MVQAFSSMSRFYKPETYLYAVLTRVMVLQVKFTGKLGPFDA